MTLDMTTVLAKSTDQMEAGMGSETLMMRVDSGRYFSVDGPGQALWNAVDGETPLSGIVDQVTQRFDVDRATCEAETLEFFSELLKQKLVTTAGA